MKTCSNCGERKPLNMFSPRGSGRLHSKCKKCRTIIEAARRKRKKKENPEAYKKSRRARYLRHRKNNPESIKRSANKYKNSPKGRKQSWRLQGMVDMDVDKWNRMFEEQEGKCFICNKKPISKLIVDHNHTTGKVRRLLCFSCNLRVGLVENRPELNDKIIEYLESYNA